MAFWGSKALLSAVELGVFTEVAKGPVDATSLAAKLGVHPRSAADFFDTLVALKMLDRDDRGRYSNTRETGQFLDQSKPGYVGGMLEMANARLYPHWSKLTDALRTGQPQNESSAADDDGTDHFKQIYADEKRLELFLKAMTGISLGSGRAMAQKIPWSRVKTVLDVGCAEGGLPVQLASAHAHLRVTGFDLPQVKPVFERYVTAHKLADRVQFTGGDVFKDQLPTADAIVLGHMLHGWDVDAKVAMLRKTHAALPEGGMVIVYDAMIDDARRENAFGLLMSLNMLIETHAGFDYTPSQCQAWLKQAGFRDVRCEHLLGPDSMCIGIK